MTSPAYDIFRQKDAQLIWVEAATDLRAAQRRIRDLTRENRAVYVIYDQRKKQMVESSN